MVHRQALEYHQECRLERIPTYDLQSLPQQLRKISQHVGKKIHFRISISHDDVGAGRASENTVNILHVIVGHPLPRLGNVSIEVNPPRQQSPLQFVGTHIEEHPVIKNVEQLRPRLFT